MNKYPKMGRDSLEDSGDELLAHGAGDIEDYKLEIAIAFMLMDYSNSCWCTGDV